jgi:hypothetical protein
VEDGGYEELNSTRRAIPAIVVIKSDGNITIRVRVAIVVYRVAKRRRPASWDQSVSATAALGADAEIVLIVAGQRYVHSVFF